MMTQLRQRMLEELQRRNYSAGTIRLYLQHVAVFAQHFHRSPDQLGAEEIRRYQLFLIQEKKLAWSSYNQIVCALRFFYAKTLKRACPLEDIPFSRKEQRLPLILSQEEVARILTAPTHLKSRALLMTIYAAGLRRSEVARLRVHDIDSARMTITVQQGKGQKDRVLMLSPVLLETLRQYWGYEKPKEWLFPVYDGSSESSGRWSGKSDSRLHERCGPPPGVGRSWVTETCFFCDPTYLNSLTTPYLLKPEHPPASAAQRLGPNPDFALLRGCGDPNTRSMSEIWLRQIDFRFAHHTQNPGPLTDQTPEVAPERPPLPDFLS